MPEDTSNKTFPWIRRNRISHTKFGLFMAPPMPTTDIYKNLLTLLINAEDYHNTMPVENELDALNNLSSAIERYKERLIKKQPRNSHEEG